MQTHLVIPWSFQTQRSGILIPPAFTAVRAGTNSQILDTGRSVPHTQWVCYLLPCDFTPQTSSRECAGRSTGQEIPWRLWNKDSLHLHKRPYNVTAEYTNTQNTLIRYCFTGGHELRRIISIIYVTHFILHKQNSTPLCVTSTVWFKPQRYVGWM